ncbi:hypothetical protein D3C81_1007990 [compost metagenome]
MEDFCSNTKSFFEAWCSYRKNHELLNVNVVVSMLTTVDDVHHWYWKSFSVESAKVYVQWKIQSISSCTSYCHGYSKNCVRTQFTFVRSSVQSDHQFIDAELVKSVHTDHFWSDKFIYVFNSFQYTFTEVTGFVAITKFNSFMRTSGCT